MKRVALGVVAVAFGVAVSFNGAEAQDTMRDVKDQAAFALESGHVDTKHIIGMKVVTPDGKHVGEIDQLIMNAGNGKVSHAVVGLGGLAGIGERHVVVPWSQVKIRGGRDRKDMAAMVDRAALDNARRYSADARDVPPAASPATAPGRDRDGDGVRDRLDRAPKNPNKQ
jgi:sporulation protein YlmC with PRC-barrel domain